MPSSTKVKEVDIKMEEVSRRFTLEVHPPYGPYQLHTNCPCVLRWALWLVVFSLAPISISLPAELRRLRGDSCARTLPSDMRSSRMHA